MTPEEKAASLEVLKKAIVLANKYGHQLMDECDGNAAVCATAAAIMLSTFCSAADMSMHDAMGLFMSVHKQTEAMTGGKA